jgi:hypothetical protein
MVECKVIRRRMGFRSKDCQTVSRAAAETEPTQENIQDWLQLDQGNLRVQLLTNKQTKQTPWPGSVSELYRPSNRRFSAKLVPTCADRGCHVVSVTDPYGRILEFLDRFSF